MDYASRLVSMDDDDLVFGVKVGNTEECLVYLDLTTHKFTVVLNPDNWDKANLISAASLNHDFEMQT